MRPVIACARARENSARPAKRQIDALPADKRVLAIGKRSDAVEEQPRRPAPHHDVAMRQPISLRLVAALQSAEQEDRRQAERYRDDRLTKILLVPVLMQRHA